MPGPGSRHQEIGADPESAGDKRPRQRWLEDPSGWSTHQEGYQAKVKVKAPEAI